MTAAGGMPIELSTVTLTGEERKRFGELADLLIPQAHGMPSVTEAHAEESSLDRVLRWRPDLAEALHSILRADPTTSAAQRLEAVRADEDAWSALTLVTAAAYYMTPSVRDRIGYPGQVGRILRDDDFILIVESGLLEPVLERGPIYREPPATTERHKA
jgi:hypothetical protein